MEEGDPREKAQLTMKSASEPHAMPQVNGEHQQHGHIVSLWHKINVKNVPLAYNKQVVGCIVIKIFLPSVLKCSPQ